LIEHKPTGPVDRLTYTFCRVAMWGPAFIVAIIFYEVVMRYVFLRPTLWVNEMSLWAGGFIFITSGLYAMQQRSHIRIFVLYDMAPTWLRRLFDILSVICVAIFAFSVLWGGFGEAAAKFARWEAFGTAWDPPIPATNKPLVLVTIFVLSIQSLSNLIRDWPADAWIRQVFDIAVAIIVVGLCLWALPLLWPSAESDMAVPTVWRIFIGLLLLGSIALSIVGIVRDFNTTPEPIEESHDPLQEHDLPDDLMSGIPPADDAAPGKHSDAEPHQKT
jgi:TRAP-type mannitol/chloroaromatic compound transport system permease small subunit